MSGVFTQNAGLNHAACGPVTSWRYSSSSALVLRHAKYVYDCWKPTLPSACIIAGRVNASARKTTSGCAALTSRMTRSQNHSGFVCGLSTRKICTPQPTHSSMIRSTSATIPCGSLSKLTG
jgi:hypothetical protein